MVHAKNYEIASAIVKVMQKKTDLFFSGLGVDEDKCSNNNGAEWCRFSCCSERNDEFDSGRFSR